MVTIPYPDEKHAGRTGSPGPRLIIAFSCVDPLRQVNDWTGQSIDLTGVDDVRIGRGEKFELVRGRYQTDEVIFGQLPDVHLSSHHLRLMREPGEPGEPDHADRWYLEDLGSTNGTWVNGERVTRAALEDNDVIEIGATILLYREASRTARMALRPLSDEDGDAADPLIPELATLNPELAAVVATLPRIAPSDLTILVTGPTGAGKEVIARAIHRLSGRSGPFVAVNCSAFPPALISSELFGVEKGAFSGADRSRPGLVRSAEHGTLFLDEIAELPESCQAVLLRVLQERQVMPVGGTTPIDVDVRVLAATHQDLPARVEDGSFREDLLARLRGFTVTLPPLCQRREDIGLLIARLLPAADDRESEIQFSRRAGAQMFIYHWPENVRELETTLRAAVLLAGGETIDLEHLPAPVANARAEAETAVAKPPNQEEQLRALYKQHRGNVTAMSRTMKTSRSQVKRLLERYRIIMPKG